MKYTKEVPKTTGERVKDYLKHGDGSKTKTDVNWMGVFVGIVTAITTVAGLFLKHDIAKKEAKIREK